MVHLPALPMLLYCKLPAVGKADATAESSLKTQLPLPLLEGWDPASIVASIAGGQERVKG